MTAASDYLEQKFLEHLTGHSSWTAPSALYVALMTGDPLDNAQMANVYELSGGGYERLEAEFDQPADGQTANTDELTFSNLVTNGAPITHVAIFDAATGGNMLLHGPLLEPRAVPNGEAAYFAPGDLTLSMD